MTITIDDTIGDIIDQCPNYQEIFKKHWGKPVPDIILKLTKSLKVRHTASRANWSQEQIEAFLKDINNEIAKKHDKK